MDVLNFPGTAVIGDPAHSSIGQIVLEHAEGNVLYDRLADIQATLGYELLKPSTHPDPAERAKENHTRAQLFAEIMMRRRAGELSAAPLMEEWITALLLLFLFQAHAKPLRILPYGLMPGTDEFRALVRDCTLPETASARDAGPATTPPGSSPCSSSPARRLKRRGRRPTDASSPSDAGDESE